MPLSLAENISLKSITCGSCGITFALPENRYDELLRTKTSFYCPNGHERRFLAKTEAEELREKLAREEQRRKLAEETAHAEAKRAERAEASLDRTKATLKRERKRVNNGVCPCCNRTFTDLGRHMKSKHPDHPNSNE